MADLLPSTPDTSAAEDGEPRVVGLDSDDADELMSALSSSTARELLAALHDQPATPSELADTVDTSLQNAQYHIGNLEDAGVIEVADTIYSEKGREMKVYAPADQPLVVFAGREEQTTGLKAALSRLLGGLGAVAAGSLVVEELFGGGAGSLISGPVATGGGGEDDAADLGGAAGNETTTAEPTDTQVSADTTAVSAGGDGGDGGGGGGGVNADTPTPEPTTTESDVSIMNVGNESGTATTTESGYTLSSQNATVDAAGTPTATPQPTATQTATRTATEAPTATPTSVPDTTAMTGETVRTTVEAAGAADAGVGLPPGALFFLGGVTVLTLWMTVWFVRR